MSPNSLWQDIRSNPLALLAAVVLHVVVIVLLSINLIGSEVHVPQRKPQKTVEAVVVDAKQVEREIEKLKQQELQKQQQLESEQDRVKRQIEAEKKRLADLKKKQDAGEQKRKAELERKRQAEKQQRLEAEKQKRLEAEKQQRLEAEKQKQLEAERKRKAEEARIAEEKRKEAERQKRLAEEAERKRREEEARRKQEEEELRQKLAEEERLEQEAREAAAREELLNRLRLQYVMMIEQKVERSWLRPAGVSTTSACEVRVTQTRLGDVSNVILSGCQGNAAYLDSIKRAVLRASPLPAAPDPAVFDKEIHFVFRPKL